jgi:hypothetical protein
MNLRLAMAKAIVMSFTLAMGKHKPGLVAATVKETHHPQAVEKAAARIRAALAAVRLQANNQTPTHQERLLGSAR